MSCLRRSHLIQRGMRRATTVSLTLALMSCAAGPSPHPPQTPPAPVQPTLAPATAPAAARAPAPTPEPSALPAASASSETVGVASAATAPDLARRIEAFVAQPRFAAASWGINVVALDSGRTLYAHDAGKLAIPASNAKLYTTALALHELGPGYRIVTSLYATAKARPDGVLAGNLILYGRGDPTLGSGSDSNTPGAWADQLAQTLAARGVRRVRGDLIADDTYFAGTPIGAGWEAGDLQSWYAPPASALSVQGNVFTLRVDRHGKHCCNVSAQPDVPGLQITNLTASDSAGPNDRIDIYRAPGADLLQVFGNLPAGTRTRHYALSAPDPALLAGGLLRDALIGHGIKLTGRIQALHWPQTDAAMQDPGLVHVADVRSPPLRDIVRHMLKHSDNLYAQLLLLQVGVHTSAAGQCVDRASAPDTAAGWGLCALRQLLAQIGMGRGDVLFGEGSGLSREDMVTPAATTRLLGWITRQPFAATVLDALPVAGVDGTLHHRLRHTAAAGNLRGKTGTLSYCSALSGYVTAANGERLVFSLMLNNYEGPSDAGGRALPPSPRQDIDTIAAMLANYGATPPDPSAAH